MGEITGIAWTDHTWNPWIGCTKVGPGCDHCYAEATDKRYRWGGAEHWGPGVPRRRTSAQVWNEPARWSRMAAQNGLGRKVFCGSLCDFFDNEVDPVWRADAFKVIEANTDLRWQLTTKRVSNVAKMVPKEWLAEGGWPGHVGVLATMVNQEEVDRDLPRLIALKALYGVPWVGISYEPAIGPITLRGAVVKPDWLIIGGESTQAGKCRPFRLRWAYDLIEELKAAPVAIFVKQLGSVVIDAGSPLPRLTGKNDRPELWPEALRLRNFPEAML